MHQAEVALLDEVEQGQARGLVLLGDGDHQSEVGLDEGLLGPLSLQGGAPQLPLLRRGQALRCRCQLGVGLPAGLDGLGQSDLVVLGQQRVLADVGQIQPNQIFVVSLEALLCQLHRVLRFPHRGGADMVSDPDRAVSLNCAVCVASRAQRLLLSKFTGRVNPSSSTGLWSGSALSTDPEGDQPDLTPAHHRRFEALEDPIDGDHVVGPGRPGVQALAGRRSPEHRRSARRTASVTGAAVAGAWLVTSQEDAR